MLIIGLDVGVGGLGAVCCPAGSDIVLCTIIDDAPQGDDANTVKSGLQTKLFTGFILSNVLIPCDIDVKDV